MKGKSAVIERFGEGPVIKEFDITPLKEKEVLVKIESAGVCGSDLHIFRGNDPRIRLPMIPGHEGVGRVADVRGEVFDVEGGILQKGDRVIWDRGIVCGKCMYCKSNRPYLCENRKVYGITFSVNDEPFPNGCYSEYIKLSLGTGIVKVKSSISPDTLVPVNCSGATSFHAVEEAELKGDESVLIQGPGPLGIFTAVFCREKGVQNIIMSGSSKSKVRMEMAIRFGVKHLIYRDKLTDKEQVRTVQDITGGRGADVVFETAGTAQAVESGQYFVGKGGRYIITGVAVPVGPVGIEIYENLVRKNAALKGVWVSDTSHLCGALKVVEQNRYPFDSVISRRFSLDSARDAIESIADRSVLKTVINP
jgi:threonine dehydrogenase-like Zn-dependent dehydrogenase